MQLHVLGSAAGGGVPQWNCACSNCTAARHERLPQRTQASIAASADGRTWVLFNATTDVRAQIERDPALAPRALRQSPIGAIFLTDANVDHTAGLLDFRQAGALRVYSTGVVRETLGANPMFRPFMLPPRSWDALATDEVVFAGLRIRAVPVPGLLPDYAGGARVDGAAAAFTIQDETGACVLYAPVFLETDARLEAEANRSDAVFFDGSFWTDDELITLALGSRTAREMGHAPIEGPGGSFDCLLRAGCPHKFYTHVNNSNPILDPSSAQALRLRGAGIQVAQDGSVFTILPSSRGVNLGA